MQRRVTREVRADGVTDTTYTYDSATGHLATVTDPKGQVTTYTYLADGAVAALTFTQAVIPTPGVTFTYDPVYPRVAMMSDGTGTTTYGYHPAGSLGAGQVASVDGPLTDDTVDDAVTSWTYDALNRLVTQQGGGRLRFARTLSEPANVTVAGQPALVTGGTQFEASVPVGAGTQTVPVTATDGRGNATTVTYQVNVAENAKAFTYDANGNLTSDGARTFEWDARHQVIAVNHGTHRSEFSYDALRRRVGIVEKENGVVQSDTRVVWCEMSICEERAADGSTVTRQPFTRGEQIGGVSRFFGPDHVGSVTEVTDTSATLLARYAFDPWGGRTVVAGSDVTTVGYTGHRAHDASALALTMCRGYDPATVRWVSEDPASHVGGLNLYGYVVNNPIRKIDAYGLAPWGFVLCWWYYGKCEKSAKKCEAEMRKCDMVEVMTENGCRGSWGACVVMKCFVENPDSEKAWKYCGKSTIPTRPPGTR